MNSVGTIQYTLQTSVSQVYTLMSGHKLFALDINRDLLHSQTKHLYFVAITFTSTRKAVAEKKKEF